MLVVVMLAIFTFGFVQYSRVNNQGFKNTEEIVIHQGQNVKLRDVEFKIKKVSHKKVGDFLVTSVDMNIKRTGKMLYGDKSNYPYFSENLWMNLPYTISSRPVSLTDTFGNKFDYEQFKTGKSMEAKATFKNDRSRIAEATEKPRLSFLIPEGKAYKKYSLFLNI